jgi:hypothetical protein
MGNDGGSIPKRRELVKEAARAPTAAELKESISEQQKHNWTNCPLSHKQLQAPVVSDCLGRLFNKDAVIEYLLGSSKSDGEDADDEEAAMKLAEMDKIVDEKIKVMRDVVEVKFEEDKEANSKTGMKVICPVMNKPLGPGGAKAVYLVPCGHAFSAEAIKELAEDRRCPQCTEEYTKEDVIPILPFAVEDIKRLEARVEKLKEKGLTHSLKKVPGSKKKRKNGEDESEKPKKSNGTANGSTKLSGIKNAATASLAAKVRDEQEAKNKKRKLANNENLNSLFSSRDQSRNANNSGDYMTRGFAIPEKEKR